MHYVRTRAATGFQARRSAWQKLVSVLLLPVPKANPDYEPRLPLVREWLIEFDDDGWPRREIGLDGDGRPLLRGPDHRNHGFWLDADMRLGDLDGESIVQELFEQQWLRAESHVES